MRVPLWLKLAYHVWLLGWLIAGGKTYPYPHFFWLCYLGNVVVGIALWTENNLLFSWQAVSLFFVDVFWTFDVSARALSLWSAEWAGRVVFNYHSQFGTDYMFDPTIDSFRKTMSMFHMLMPLIFFWGMYRFGYDRRAIWLQLATIAIVFPLTYWVSLNFGDVQENIKDNINWVFGPFGKPQNPANTGVSRQQFLLIALLLYPIVMHIPSHFLLTAMFSGSAGRASGKSAKARG
ncbi:MAG TPA: hypothetical protein VKS79_11950 [Gemmataceae bacterium]|nr:hypothetical protein [Gemmataceae bacterium]